MIRRFVAVCGVAALGVAALAGCVQLEVAYLNATDTIEFEADGGDLLVNGTLNSRSLVAFEQAMADHPNVTRLVLLEIPGSVDDEVNLQLGHRVRDLGLDTHVTAESEIHSGGSDLFLAGVQRSMENGAVIGVHSWAVGNLQGRDLPKSDPEHAGYVSYTKRMLGSDAFYWFTLEAAPVQETHVMSAAEIEKYGLLTQPVVRN
ncbi:alpha/beta hydrolase [uncultured Shimia sp.]|mgnify:CR=1 FL=1|uniref:alpha/beta hydrolase n=1 Tax=uncultured Shimia sp. TaxID=573152 RepID=UPI0025E515EC|nr:alpha/beta hydrolase [uncultured Shimia sp.]